MDYYAVKNLDGSYLEKGGKNFTFDKTKMQLFLDKNSAENEAFVNGFVVDNELISVVSIVLF